MQCLQPPPRPRLFRSGGLSSKPAAKRGCVSLVDAATGNILCNFRGLLARNGVAFLKSCVAVVFTSHNVTHIGTVSEDEVRCCVISRDGRPSLDLYQLAALAVVKCTFPEVALFCVLTEAATRTQATC